MRWKCTDTPSGANAIISGSTVGFPGGSRNPSRALQPIILLHSVRAPTTKGRHPRESGGLKQPVQSWIPGFRFRGNDCRALDDAIVAQSLYFLRGNAAQ